MLPNESEILYNYGKAIRSMCEHEDRLINDRMKWFLTIQGYLFAALSFLWKKQLVLIIIFCFIGVIVCISFWFLIQCGLNAIKDFAKQWEQKLTEAPNYDGPYVKKYHRKLGRAKRFLIPWNILPFLISIIWITILILLFTNNLN